MTFRYYVKGRNGAYASGHLADVDREIKDFLQSVATPARGAAAQAMGEYFIGTGERGLRHYPAYKMVTRAAAYGRVASDGAPPGYFSWKQFRYVQWMRAKGRIDPGYPHRMGRLQRAWRMTRRGSDVRIFNTEPHVLWVMGDGYQSRHEKKVGWRIVSKIFESNMDGALLAGQRAAVREIKRKAKE